LTSGEHLVKDIKSVLYLNKGGEIGGAEVSLQTLVGSLEGTGYRPVVALGQEGLLGKRFERMSVKNYLIPLNWCQTSNPFPFFRTIRSLRHIIKKEGIKLIHSNMHYDNQYGVISARLARIPHILHVRNYSRGEKYSWKEFYRLGSVAICNSYYTSDQFVISSGFKKRVEVVYNGVDCDKFKPDLKKRNRLRRDYGFDSTDFVMGMAGRFIEDKGFLPLLNCVLPILRRNQNYKIIMCGDDKCYYSEPDYLERMRSVIGKNNLGNQVVISGFIEDMPSFYNGLDLFLLPSKKEPFGRVLIEAMATKIAIVASNVDGVPEVVGHGKTGCLVNPQDPNGWCECIDKLSSDEPLRKQFGEAGRREVLAKFTSEHVTSKVVSIYNELIDVG